MYEGCRSLANYYDQKTTYIFLKCLKQTDPIMPIVIEKLPIEGES